MTERKKKWVRVAMGSKEDAYLPLGPKVCRRNKQFRWAAEATVFSEDNQRRE